MNKLEELDALVKRLEAETGGLSMMQIDDLMSEAASRLTQLADALTEYLGATASVFEIDPFTGRCWAELDPRGSDQCLRRFQRLHDAGKRARAALGSPPDA